MIGQRDSEWVELGEHPFVPLGIVTSKHPGIRCSVCGESESSFIHEGMQLKIV